MTSPVEVDLRVGAERFERDLRQARQAFSNTIRRMRSESVRGRRAALQLLDVKTVRQEQQEIRRLEAAYSRLARSGRLSAEDQRRAQEALKRKLREVRGEQSQTLALLRRFGPAISAGLVTAGVTRFGASVLQATKRAEGAFRGLASQAEFLGLSVKETFNEALALSADGLLNVADASKGLQNLLARGFTVEQAVNTLNRLKDAAAFNRQASLSLSEAVRSATEGLKNENSVLVDNAGVTKNVSVLWKEYADSIGKTVSALTQAEKVQAEYLGIQRETEAQQGNAAKAAAGFEGELNKLGKASEGLLVAAGPLIRLFLKPLIQFARLAVEFGLKPLVFSVEALISGIGFLGGSLLALATGDFKLLSGLTDEFVEGLEKAAERYRKGLLPAAQDATDAVDDEITKRRELHQEQARLAQLETDLKKTATEQEKKNAREVLQERRRTAEARLQDTRQALRRALEAERRYTQEIRQLVAAQAGVRRSIADEIRALRRRDLSEAEQQADIESQVAEKIIEARAAVDRGDTARGRSIADELRGLAGTLQDTDRAVAALAAVQELLEAATELEVQQAERARAAQRERAASLKAELETRQALVATLAGELVALDDIDPTITIRDNIHEVRRKILRLRLDLAKLGGGDVKARAGGRVGLARGGRLGGYGGGDSVRALLEPGEFVIRKEAVRRYGAQLFEALNGMRAFRVPDISPLPRFQTGGPVTTPAGGGETVTVRLEGRGRSAEVFAPRDQARAFVDMLQELERGG